MDAIVSSGVTRREGGKDGTYRRFWPLAAVELAVACMLLSIDLF